MREMTARKGYAGRLSFSGQLKAGWDEYAEIMASERIRRSGRPGLAPDDARSGS